MNGDKNRIKIYVSHPIRGMRGKDATAVEIRFNNKTAMAFGEALSKEFPNIEFYVPAAHDEFVLIGYEAGILTEKEILYIDCKIVDTCQAVIAYVPERYISYW